MFCRSCGHEYKDINSPCTFCGHVNCAENENESNSTSIPGSLNGINGKNDQNNQYYQQAQPNYPGQEAPQMQQPYQQQPHQQPYQQQPYGYPDAMNQIRTKNSWNPFRGNQGRNFGLLFLSAFLSQFSFIPLSIILYTSKKPVPQIYSPILMILSFALFVITIGMYFSKRYDSGVIKTKGILQRAVSVFTGILLLGLLTLLFALLYKEISRYIPDILNNSSTQVTIFAAIVAAGILLTFLSFIVIVLVVAGFRFSLSSTQIAGAFAVIIKKCLVLFPLALVFSLISGAGLYMLSYVQAFYTNLLEPVFPYSYLSAFFMYLLGSFTSACFLLLVIILSDNILDSCQEKICQLAQRTSKKPVPILIVFVLALTTALYIFTVPLGGGAAERIIGEIKMNIELGNTYGAAGMNEMSIYEYRQAYSKILSFKGFLDGVKAYNSGDASLSKAVSAGPLLDESSKITYKNQYTQFFRGKLSLFIKSYSTAAEQFKQQLYFPNPLSGSYFGLLEAYNGMNDIASANLLIERMIGQEMFFDNMSGFANINENQANKYIDRLDELELAIGPKMAYAAYEKVKYNDMYGALNDLTAMQKKFPQDPLISYFIAKVASEYKNEQNNYQLIKDYTAAFENQSKASGAVSDEVNLKLFASYMYLAANDAQNAQRELSSLYYAYPGNAEVARQYAYVLNFQKNPDEALKVLGSLTAKDPEDYYALYLTASSYILKNDAVSALDNMGKFLEITSKNKDLKPTLDKLLYSFSLSFSKILSPDVLNNVEAIKSNVLLYNYIYAIKGWKEQNSDMSNQYIDKVIEADEGLGYALYIKGINNYEKAVRTGQTDFSEAEKYYKLSLGILPNHVEGYFALAHCYKKWGKNLDALRAFRMVTILLPFEDHRTDPYGMTVHAQGEVSGLTQYDIKDGE